MSAQEVAGHIPILIFHKTVRMDYLSRLQKDCYRARENPARHFALVQMPHQHPLSYSCRITSYESCLCQAVTWLRRRCQSFINYRNALFNSKKSSDSGQQNGRCASCDT
jgi:hypothetical protein